jgi:glycogen(starch) synthase
MKHFDVLLVPSRFEPFGLVALEGMSLGIPVVASEVAGLSEIIAPGADNLEVAWRVPSENPHALAEAIKAILFDPFEREQRVKHARERVNGQFSPQLFVERYIGLYRSLISP